MNEELASKLIKRYPNRKLYDTESSTYVTLDDIATMVKAGRELTIIDHKTGNDITNVTLAQIVFEEGKRKKSVLPVTTLRDLIQQRGEQVRGFVDRFVHDNPLSHAREEAEEKVQTLIRRGESARDESGRFFRDLLGSYTRNIEELQNKLEDRIHEVGDRVASLPSALSDIKAVADQLEKVEKRLEAVENRLAKVEGKKSTKK